MIATVHAVDLSPLATVGAVLRGRPRPGDVRGLRWAETGVLAPLAFTGAPPLNRAVLLAFWDDEEAVDRFEAGNPAAERFAGGFHARLRPLRAHGSWPGLPADVPTDRSVPHEGPVVVLTLAYVRAAQVVRFLRTSRPAEKTAAADERMLWGTAVARPPFAATVSIWESGQAAATYAYGRSRPEHSDAIGEQQRKEFHKQSAFVRFAPLRLEGSLSGTNPLSTASITI